MSKQQQQPQRELPKDVYDYLELAALAFGGIGGGEYTDSIALREPDPLVYYDYGEYATVPMCAIGFAHLLIVDGGSEEERFIVETALRDAGIEEDANDAAVARINRRRGKDEDARVTFKAWTKELNVVRGS